jgi:hypothetical protein
MSQKPKVSIQRGDDFQEVDSLLSEAMADLDDRNARVSQLLQAEADPAISNPELLVAAELAEEAAEDKAADAPQGADGGDAVPAQG